MPASRAIKMVTMKPVVSSLRFPNNKEWRTPCHFTHTMLFVLNARRHCLQFWFCLFRFIQTTRNPQGWEMSLQPPLWDEEFVFVFVFPVFDGSGLHIDKLNVNTKCALAKQIFHNQIQCWSICQRLCPRTQQHRGWHKMHWKWQEHRLVQRTDSVCVCGMCMRCMCVRACVWQSVQSLQSGNSHIVSINHFSWLLAITTLILDDVLECCFSQLI